VGYDVKPTDRKATHVLGAECTFNLYRPTPDSRVESKAVYQGGVLMGRSESM
jgi:hypothetical protein